MGVLKKPCFYCGRLQSAATSFLLSAVVYYRYHMSSERRVMELVAFPHYLDVEQNVDMNHP
jgi:hypothetical protein